MIERSKAMRTVVLTAILVALAACDRSPSSASAAPEASEPTAQTGTVPTALVGKWAADPAWCPNETGETRPIEITATRFEGYENSCAVVAVTEQAGAYVAELSCQAEGQTVTERTRWTLSGQVLTQSWPSDHPAGAVQFTRCPVVTTPSS
ncbi:MAG: hypothetical protein HZY74_01300 [Brevundimonas sp.]|nr:MAG: hypothetical protein HZY74_01300 [Brevundimonas sp.]